MRLSYQHRLPFIAVVAFLLTMNILNSQVNAQSVPESFVKNANWVLFAASATKTYEYDQSSIERQDSMHILIRIKETPKKLFYTQIQSEKMREHRSLQNYEDRVHLVYDYEGYEKYAATVTEEKVDGSLNRYSILKRTDYDLNGTVLSMKKEEPAAAKWVTTIGAVPEISIISIVMHGKKGNDIARHDQE